MVTIGSRDAPPSDVELPGALTAGRRTLRVELRVLPARDPAPPGTATGWSDARYTASSVLAPRATP